MSARHSNTAEIFNKNRRIHKERRRSSDRRNLIRFEDLGIDRRAGMTRRKDEFYWDEEIYSGTD